MPSSLESSQMYWLKWVNKRNALLAKFLLSFCSVELSRLRVLTIDSLVLVSFWRNTFAFLRAGLFQVQWHVELAQVKPPAMQSLTNPGKSIIRKTRKKNYGGFARNETPSNTTENIRITRLFSKCILRHAENLLAFVCSWHQKNTANTTGRTIRPKWCTARTTWREIVALAKSW